MNVTYYCDINLDRAHLTFPHFEPNNSGSTRASPISVRLTWV